MDSITLSHRGKSHADKVHPHERVVTYCHCLLWSMNSTQIDFENSSLTLLTLDSGSADHTIVFFFFLLSIMHPSPLPLNLLDDSQAD